MIIDIIQNINLDIDIYIFVNKFILYSCRYENRYDLCYINKLFFYFVYDSFIKFEKKIYGLNSNIININSHEGISFIMSQKFIDNGDYYSCCCNQVLYEIKNELLPIDKFKDNSYIDKFIIYFSIINYFIKNTKNKTYYLIDINIQKIKKYNQLYHYKTYIYI